MRMSDEVLARSENRNDVILNQTALVAAGLESVKRVVQSQHLPISRQPVATKAVFLCSRFHQTARKRLQVRNLCTDVCLNLKQVTEMLLLVMTFRARIKRSFAGCVVDRQTGVKRFRIPLPITVNNELHGHPCNTLLVELLECICTLFVLVKKGQLKLELLPTWISGFLNYRSGIPTVLKYWPHYFARRENMLNSWNPECTNTLKNSISVASGFMGILNLKRPLIGYSRN